MARRKTRREFVRDLGLSAAVWPFVAGLPGLARAASAKRRQRLVVMFSPNGVVPNAFWPKTTGPDFDLPASLEPLAPFRDRTLVLHGVCDKVRGDGDAHMRGIGCLLTGTELFPGNIQGGSHTPAGWSSGLSIDQEIRGHLQKSPETRTRFGSLEFGVLVPERADTWTRMVYAGANQPIAPVDDPYRMFAKLYGRARDEALVASVLDDVRDDLRRLRAAVGSEDRRLLDEHAAFVRDMERDLQAARTQGAAPHPAPVLEPGVKEETENMPRLSRMQLDLLAGALANDFARVTTIQYTHSVGGAKMRWLGVEEGHHQLSHEPDSNESAQKKLVDINRWYCGELAYLAKKLADTPAPGGGSLLDETLIVWTNELGKGNSHTLDDIPFVLVGGAPGFRTGRALKLPKVPHNRLLLSLAQAFDHPLERFGNPDFCAGGALELG